MRLVAILAALLVGTFLMPTTMNIVYGQDITLDSTINLSNNTGTATQPRLVAAGSNVFAVWSDNTPGNSQIFFAKSTNGGATYGGTINISTSTGTALVPQIAVSGNNVYIVWHEYRAAVDNYDIYFAKSTDSGATFSSSINLSSTSGMSSNAQIAVSGSYLHVVWMDSTIGNGETYYTRSTDGGTTFSSAKNLSNNLGNTGGANSFPQVAVTGSYVYVVWGDDTGNFGSNDIKFVRSTDGGATFSAVKNLSNSLTPASDYPQMLASGTSVYIVWKELLPIPNSPGSYSYQMLYSRSTDNGATFGSAINLSGGGNYDKQQIAASGTNVFVVLQGGTSGLTEILLARSTDGGATFGSLINLSNTAATFSRFPTMAVSGSYLNIAWVETLTSPTTNNEIYFKRSLDGGLTFDAPINLSANAGSSEDPRSMAPDSSTVYVLWRDASVGNYDTLFRKGTAQSTPPPDTSPPTVSVTAPANGQTISDVVTVSASASDNVGVTKVEFYVDNILKSTAAASPFSFNLDTKTLANAAHSLTAKAYDAANNLGLSPAISVTVNNVVADTTPPTVSITSPANGTTMSGITTITATASDNVGVTKVDFYVDSVLKATDTTSPYSFALDTATLSNAQHNLQAKAFDAANNIGTSSIVTVTVNNPVPDTTAPTVSITSPANAATVSGTITISASASDNVAVAKVEFYVDNVLKGTDTISPYSIAFDTKTLTNTAHTIKAVAFDTPNNQASGQISMTVSNSGADTTVPTITINSPAENAIVSGITVISVSGSDASGIAKIQLFIDGSLKSTVYNVNTFSYNWDTNLAYVGKHSITTRFTDAAGNSAIKYIYVSVSR